MKIKSLEELQKIREEHENKIRLRNTGDDKEDKIEILIGMATCGISAGARETLNAFIKEMSLNKIENVKIIAVGCIGYCHSEPIVQVNVPGHAPVIYGNIKKDKVPLIVNNHIKQGKPVESLVLKVDFERI